MASSDLENVNTVVGFNEDFPNRTGATENLAASSMIQTVAIDIESNQTNMEVARSIHEYNEMTRLQQLWFTGLSSVIRAAAVFQIANAQYHNNFGFALKVTSLFHAVYGISLVAGMTRKCCSSTNIETNDMFQRESEMSCSKNYALTGVGNVIGATEALLFSFAAPEDPLADLAIVFGSVQFALGAISCVYPGYLMLKEVPCLKNLLPKDNSEYQSSDFHEHLKRKLERSRWQQFYSIGASHAGRGAAVIFDLANEMPSQLYVNMLIAFGASELSLGLYALLCHPISSAHYYLTGTHKQPMSLEEGSRNFNILRAVGFLTMAPVNIVYTLGVPDAKTPWILGLSALAISIAILSGWNPIWDYFGCESMQCKRYRVFPV